jgi:hypothetical protein
MPLPDACGRIVMLAPPSEMTEVDLQRIYLN